jgi:adenine-specific DNA-methyltransferase
VIAYTTDLQSHLCASPGHRFGPYLPPGGLRVFCFGCHPITQPTRAGDPGIAPPCGFRLSEDLCATNAKTSSEPSENAHAGLGRQAPRMASPGVSRATSETRDLKEISAMATTAERQQSSFTNQILHGDCIETMREMPAKSVDFVLTDPPYLVNYRDRDGRTIQNDADDTWLKPAMAEAYRVLKQNRVAIMFYGWTKIDMFFDAWKDAGFQPVGHIVFRKSYSSKSRFLRYQHEMAFLLAKGRPPLPKQPLGDVMEMPFSGNKLHPTQKPVTALAPLVRSFTLPGELVLDPFAGSGSSCVAALLTGRNYIGIEMDDAYYQQASSRLNRVRERVAAKRHSPFAYSLP